MSLKSQQWMRNKENNNGNLKVGDVIAYQVDDRPQLICEIHKVLSLAVQHKLVRVRIY